jgi:phage gp16-like protein
MALPTPRITPRAITLTPARRAMLAKLHLARKQLALTEDSYRDVLRRVTGLDSAAAMTEAQLDRTLAEFKRLGFKPKSKGASLRRSQQAQIRMIHAVWQDICDIGIDAEDQAVALRAFVRRQTRGPLHPNGVDAPEFLSADQANRVLEGLKAWRARLRRHPGTAI